MKNAALSTLVALAAALPAGAWAAEATGYRNILELGCHKNDGTCYVTLDMDPVTGAPGCTSNNIRWDARNDPNGKHWLALFMLAKSTNRRVALFVDHCYPGQTAFPSFSFGQIE